MLPRSVRLRIDEHFDAAPHARDDDHQAEPEPSAQVPEIAIAVANTYLPEAFDDQGNYTNAADTLFRKIGAVLVPDDAPPVPAPK